MMDIITLALAGTLIFYPDRAAKKKRAARSSGDETRPEIVRTTL